MRSILFATALAFSALVPATLRTAEACGGGGGVSLTTYPVQYRPDLFAVSRSFVLLDKRLSAKAAKKLRFTRLDPMSYDTTKTAPGEKFSTPVVLTLVGPAGTKVIKATRFTWVDVGSEHAEPRAGIAVEGDYRIAIDGDVPSATWEELSQMMGSTVAIYSGAGTQFVSPFGSHSTSIGNTRRSVDGYPIGIVHVATARFVAMMSSTKQNQLSAEAF